MGSNTNFFPDRDRGCAYFNSNFHLYVHRYTHGHTIPDQYMESFRDPHLDLYPRVPDRFSN